MKLLILKMLTAIKQPNNTLVKKSVVCMLSVLLIFSIPALGDYTPVFQSYEPNHAQILGNIYGDGTPFIGQGDYLGNGVWTEFVSPDYSIIARRVHDFNNPVTDQIWSCDAEVFAEAKYAFMYQSFGWNQGGTTGTNYDELLTEADIGDSNGVFVDALGDYLWGIHPDYDRYFWSKPSENFDLRDHMVTYKIEPYQDLQFNSVFEPQSSIWLLCFEDLPPWRCQKDWDYNDFIVEVQCRVPEPATIALLGLGSLVLVKRKSRISKIT